MKLSVCVCHSIASAMLYKLSYRKYAMKGFLSHAQIPCFTISSIYIDVVFYGHDRSIPFYRQLWLDKAIMSLNEVLYSDLTLLCVLTFKSTKCFEFKRSQ